MSPIRRELAKPWPRAVAGMAISGAFIVATVSSVDHNLVAEAWSAVGLGLVAVAAAVSLAEVGVRAARWRLLLRTLAPAPYAVTLGFLSIGHLANAILPARLGDLVRGLVTGARLRVSRASVLGTIAVERASDATLLGIVVTIGVLIGFRQMASTVAVMAGAALVAGMMAAATVLVLHRGSVGGTRIGGFLTHHGARFWAGATGLRRRRDLFGWIALTGASYGLTVLIFLTVAQAVGMPIPVWQAALAMASATLSTAIPAGPASIGTYEFVGMTVLSSMGLPAESSLLCVALVHVAVVAPPSTLGIAFVWSAGLRADSAGLGSPVSASPRVDRTA